MVKVNDLSAHYSNYNLKISNLKTNNFEGQLSEFVCFRLKVNDLKAKGNS